MVNKDLMEKARAVHMEMIHAVENACGDQYRADIAIGATNMAIADALKAERIAAYEKCMGIAHRVWSERARGSGVPNEDVGRIYLEIRSAWEAARTATLPLPTS